MEQTKLSRRALGIILGSMLVMLGLMTLIMARLLARLDGVNEALALSALFACVYGGAAAGYAFYKRPKTGELCLVLAFMALAMLARVVMLDYETADYASFLAPWTQVFREGGFATLAENVGDYNLIYQYVLLLISRLPICELYLIKLFSVVFDFALALVVMRAAEHFAGESTGVPVFLLMLVLPTVLLDGACWGQCDSVYVFFIILSLYALETKRPCLSAASLAVAFAFKLQTIFFFPVVLLGLIHRKYKLRHAAVFFAAYLVTMLPALIAGRTLWDALSVYANQSLGQYYHRLTYNAPNLYAFFPMVEFANTQEFTWMRYIADMDASGMNAYLNLDHMPTLQSAALYACVIFVLLIVVYWLIHYKEITPQMTLTFALFFAIFLPFVMPKIHERYFYLADILSILYAARYANRRFMPLLVAGSLLMSYIPYLMRQRPIDERFLALMMLAALVIVARDLLHAMRKNRAELAKGGAC